MQSLTNTPITTRICPVLWRVAARSTPNSTTPSELGDEQANLRPASPTTLLMGKIAWTARHAHQAIAKTFGWRWMVIWLMLRYKLDWKRKGKRDRRTALGNALIASLRASLMDRDVPLWLNTDFEDFIVDAGRVVGVRARRDGESIEIHARHGVIAAAGGFEQNQQLRDKYLPQPSRREWSATPAGQNNGGYLGSRTKARRCHRIARLGVVDTDH